MTSSWVVLWLGIPMCDCHEPCGTSKIWIINLCAWKYRTLFARDRKSRVRVMWNIWADLISQNLECFSCHWICAHMYFSTVKRLCELSILRELGDFTRGVLKSAQVTSKCSPSYELKIMCISSSIDATCGYTAGIHVLNMHSHKCPHNPCVSLHPSPENK